MSRRWWSKRARIRAVHDSDLEHLLSSLGILEQIKAGDFSCRICGSPINLTNVGAVLPMKEDIGFVCDLPPCIAKVSSLSDEGDKALD